MDEAQVLRWYADWTASAEASRVAALARMNAVLASLGLNPIKVA